MKEIIKEVIVVEGKSDTNKLKQIFGKDIKTIETKGLALNHQTLELIKSMNQQVGVIIFTDPDGPGKKIREKILQYLNSDVKNIFLKKTDMIKVGKIGVAEAKKETIIQALQTVASYNVNQQTLTWEEFLDNDFFVKSTRILICNQLGWNTKLSCKTFFKWLNWAGYDVKKINSILLQNKS